jgi:outer membrane protein TolC
MDRDVQADIPEPPVFDPNQLDWKLKDLMARSVDASPVLKALQENILRDLEAVRLAKLQYFPDLVVGGGYSFISSGGVSPVANGEDAWNLNFGISLPIWLHRIRAGILERNASVLGSALRYRSARNDIFFAIQDLTVRVDTDYRSAILFKDAIIPRARQTVEVSEREYQAGKLEFLTLIDNWRKLLVFSLQYHAALSSLEHNFAELERLAGGGLNWKAPGEIAEKDSSPNQG